MNQFARLLESVQRRWTREITGIGHLNYVERLKVMGLYSVYGRLMLADLIKCWKIFYSEGDVGLLNFFSMVVDRRIRGHSLKIVLPMCDLDLKRVFHVRVIQRWNALPEYVVTQASLLSFKRKLEVEIEHFVHSFVIFCVIIFIFAFCLCLFCCVVLLVLSEFFAMYSSSGCFSCICTVFTLTSLHLY